MTSQIKQELSRLELQHDIKILYAVESGSRAWGFASTDSDWDVRFLYIQRLDWYLQIDDKKDSMEIMLPNDLDLAGWELKKALRLYRKSNPPLLEWLNSPMVYAEPFSTAAKLRELTKEYFNPRSCIYHYLHNEVKNEIENLLTRKMADGEMGQEPKIQVLNDFLEQKITFYRQEVKSAETFLQPDTERLNVLFKLILNEVWG